MKSSGSKPGRRKTAGNRRVVLPTWIRPDHPLYLNRTLRKQIRKAFDAQGIFLNIPYSKRYTNLEIAIISTVTAYGLTPQMAKQHVRMEMQIRRILRLMLACKYGLTDLSYATRMNMPLELGLLLGFGKEIFVMSRKRYSALSAVSDLNFTPIHYHEGRVQRLITGLSYWIEQTCTGKKRSTKGLVERYRRLRRIRRKLGDDFDKLTPQDIQVLLRVAQQRFRMELPGS